MARTLFNTYVARLDSLLAEAARDGHAQALVLRAAVHPTVWAKAAPGKWQAVRAWPEQEQAALASAQAAADAALVARSAVAEPR